MKKEKKKGKVKKKGQKIKKQNRFTKIKSIFTKHIIDILLIIALLVIFALLMKFLSLKKAIILFGLIVIFYMILRFILGSFTVPKRERKKTLKKRLKVLFIIFLGFFITGIICVVLFASYIVMNAPEFNEELLYVKEPSIILNNNGEEIAKLGAEKRVAVTYDELSEVLIDAIIATEDSRFFEHNGVDWARFLKASIYQVLGYHDAGGASTLTMQVSKNAYTDKEDEGIEGIIRKFTDLYVSMFILEKNYTKEQIMEFYVNSQWLGKNTFGVEQTALTYFGKSVKDLNVSEAAMIAGLFQAPGRYDPYKNPEATEARRKKVLSLMLRHGYINKKEYEVALKMTVDKIVLPQSESIYASGEVSQYQSFIDTVVEEVKEKTGKNPYSTSMIIYTTLNTDVQDYLNDIMTGKSFTWENDVIQSGIAIVNVKDGSVVAIGGNRSSNIIDSYNFATDLNNQIGSTAKPLYDYGPAIEYNNWYSGQLIVDEPSSYTGGKAVKNWNGTFEGLETMRIALKGSRNIPALKTFKQNDKSKVINFVTNLGLTPEIYSCNDGYKLSYKWFNKAVCVNKDDVNDVVNPIVSNTLHEAHSIGGYNGESPLSMAAAYAAFANGGVYTEPYTFTKIVFKDTNEEFVNDIKKTKAMSEETAYIISDMLATTATQAMLRYYNINGVKYAAKTGTTNFDDATYKAKGIPSSAVHDLWTVGFNTEYAIGLWYGYEDKDIDKDHYNTISRGNNLRLFQAVGKKVFTNKDNFKQPSGVVAVEIESENVTAMLPSEFTPSNLRQTELFIKGTEPTTVSPRFDKLKPVSNLKSTVNNNEVTLTWDSVATPLINTEAGLRSEFSKLFENANYLDSFISGRLNYINSYVGGIGYNIYIKNDDGSLKLLDFVTSNKYTTTLDIAGDYTFVVKTSYSIFKSNMSDGVSVDCNIKSSSVVIPPKPTPDPGETEPPGETN